MNHTRLPKEEIERLIKEFIVEKDPLRHLELKFRIVFEQVKEIEEAYNRYNDSAQRQTIDAALAFLDNEKNEPKFQYVIAPSAYKGDWSS
jgi:hypothetical protein